MQLALGAFLYVEMDVSVQSWPVISPPQNFFTQRTSSEVTTINTFMESSDYVVGLMRSDTPE